MPKLSDSLARAAVPRPGKGETVIYDDELKGFALRIRASGSKSWIWRRRKPDGTPERYTIGTFPAMRAAAAREVARQRDAEHNAILHGVPVERLDRTYHRARRLEPTLGEIADQWIERFEGLM